ncbi:conserved hypothetical protein [Roseibium sp. TrichSKD4]|nr:conserved hypothetical protein [Roseibium sp. TrichSKD4]
MDPGAVCLNCDDSGVPRGLGQGDYRANLILRRLIKARFWNNAGAGSENNGDKF